MLSWMFEGEASVREKSLHHFSKQASFPMVNEEQRARVT